jgi:hypothetical protein
MLQMLGNGAFADKTHKRATLLQWPKLEVWECS